MRNKPLFRRLSIFGRSLVNATIISGLLVTVSACQTTPQAVAVDKAKKAQVAFERVTKDVPFVAPPRTISDILGLINQPVLNNSLSDPAGSSTAHRKLPPKLDAESKALFFVERALARQNLGMVRPALADARTALVYYNKTKSYQRSRMRGVRETAANLELAAGNFQNGIGHFEKLAAELTRANRPWTVSYSGKLARAYAKAGKLRKAEELAASGKTLVRKALRSKTLSGSGIALMKTTQKRFELAVHQIKGNLEGAESAQRREIQLMNLVGNPAPWSQRRARQNLARILVGQARLVEAEVVLRDLIREIVEEGTSHPLLSEIAQDLGGTLNRQGRYLEATSLLLGVIEINKTLGIPTDSLISGATILQLGKTLVSQGEWSKAMNQFDRLRRDLVENRFLYEKWLDADATIPLAMILAGRVDEATDILRKSLARDIGVYDFDAYRVAEKKGALGMALSASGNKSQALTVFREAIPEILAYRATKKDESDQTRDQRSKLILESYLDLLSRISTVRPEAAAEAFRVANAIRSRKVQRALAASGVRAFAKTDQLGELIRREQNTSMQLGALLGLLTNLISAPRDQQDGKTIEDLKTRIDLLRSAREKVQEELGEKFPEYTELTTLRPATIQDVKASLWSGESLISTYVADGAVYVWAIPKKGKFAFSVADIGREELTRKVAILRAALDPNAATLGDIPDFDVRIAHQIFRRILEPVRVGWKDAERLFIVGHGPLGYLPFSLLPTNFVDKGVEKKPLFSNYRKVPWLVRQYAVTTLPSPATLRTLRNLPPRKKTRRAFVGFGDPWFTALHEVEAKSDLKGESQIASYLKRGISLRGMPVSLRAPIETGKSNSAKIDDLPRLPDTAAEVLSIAKALKADALKDVYLGKAANEGKVKSLDLSSTSVLAFATHGLVPGDLNGLNQPALAMSSPAVAGGADDGLLTMGEIMALKLNADWVVLSACNTASGDGAGAEAVSGLGRAFFFAGTRSLLVSNWPVETTSARALTTDVFRRHSVDPLKTRAQAVRESMLEMIDRGGLLDPATGLTLFSYAHPIFWAPFTLIGDGGGVDAGT